MTAAERQRRFRQTMAQKGFVQVTGWVHEAQASDTANLMKVLMLDPDLEPSVVRNARTGRMRSVGKVRLDYADKI